MLPHVDTEYGHALGNGVLVLGRNDGKTGGLIPDEPAPAAAGDAQQGSVEGGLELVEAAPDSCDFGDELGSRLGLGGRVGGGGQVLPEEGVVDVAAAVEVDGG